MIKRTKNSFSNLVYPFSSINKTAKSDQFSDNTFNFDDTYNYEISEELDKEKQKWFNKRY